MEVSQDDEKRKRDALDVELAELREAQKSVKAENETLKAKVQNGVEDIAR